MTKQKKHLRTSKKGKKFMAGRGYQKKIATKRKLKSWIKEEKMSAKEYASYGYPNLAKDERSHARFLKKQIKQKRK